MMQLVVVLLLGLLSTGNAQTPPFYDYSLQGNEKCGMINVLMDESGSMVNEQQFMRERAITKIVQLLESPSTKLQKVFVCSNGFGNDPAVIPNTDSDGYRHLGCSLGYDASILNWSFDNSGRDEDGYSGTIKSIDRVPANIEGVDIATTCGSMAKNMILVTDEARTPKSNYNKEDVRLKLEQTGYIYNIVVNVFIQLASQNIIGMRYNYNPADFNRLVGFPNMIPNPTPGAFPPNLVLFYDKQVPNEMFAAATNSPEYVEYSEPGYLWTELLNNGGDGGDTKGDYGEIIENTRGAIFSINTMRKGINAETPELSDAFAAAIVNIKVCEMTSCRDPEIGGDPHITTWKNEHYEFHGQCDLVLAHDPKFANGMGLDVHIRTKIVRYWSYIQSVAIRIGNEILEIQGGTELNADASFWINFEHLGELEEFAGFPVQHESNKIHRRSYEIDLSSKYPGKKILIDLYREFVRVKLEGGLDTFGNTVGLLGDPRSGELLARDGVTTFDDYVHFGHEWQVLPGDGNLFHELSKPHFPEKCIQPEDSQGERHRRLEESSISVEQAEAACASLGDDMSIKDCVYDVLATQDLDMVGAF